MNRGVQYQAILMERLTNERMEKIIPRMMKLAESYQLGRVSEKSPFRNVLAISTELGGNIEVTKNFIRYQLGRSEANDVWRKKAAGESFAVHLVKEIEALKGDAEKIVAKAGEIIREEERERWVNKIHVRLVQLYLGYLSRYQTFLAAEK